MLVMDFLDKICCLSDGTTAPVYIYAGGGDFRPDDPNDLKEAELIALYQSDYKAEFVLSRRVCQMSIEEIFWTPQGIVITALELDDDDDDA
jgi:hypothetical protein